MKRVVLYPYDISNIHILQYMSMTKLHNDESQEVICITPLGWGYNGEDAGNKIGITTGIIVESEYNRFIEDADYLIITESIISLSDSKILTKIDDAIHNCKKIIVLREMSITTQSILVEKSREYKDLILYNGNHIQLYDDIEMVDSTIDEIPAPIILVLGMGERCSKFDVQLEIRKELMKKGYSLTQIGSKRYSEYYGFHSFPDFMYGKSKYSEEEKIIGFNKYLKQLYMNENPDVMIVGVPGGVFPYDSLFHNGFGILNYYVSRALRPDYIIYNSLYIDSLSKYLEEVSNQLCCKFDYEIDQIYVSNYALNYSVSKSDKVLSYITCKTKFIVEKTGGLNVFNVYDNDMKKNSVDKLLKTLQGYSSIQLM